MWPRRRAEKDAELCYGAHRAVPAIRLAVGQTSGIERLEPIPVGMAAVGAFEGLHGRQLDAVFDALPDVVVVLDRLGLVVWANRAAADLSGDDPATWVGRSSFELVHPDDLGLAAASLESVQGKRAGTPIELRVRSRSGWRLMELLGASMDGGYSALVLRDLTERRRWEVAGDDVSRFRAIVHHAAGMTVLLDADGTVESTTAAVTRLLGYDPEDVWGSPLANLIAPEDRPLFAAAVSRAVEASDAGGVAATAEVNLARSDGTYVPMELSIVSLLNDPVVHGLVVSCHDITRLRAAQQALSLLAHHDPLTGLLNRRSFDAVLQREWLLTQRDGIDSYVVMVDLDGFKAVNDAHGHAAGDDLLRVVGAALERVARDTDVCGRLGGDEFGVVLVRCGGEAAAIGFCDRLGEILAGEVATVSEGLGASCGYQSLRQATSPTEALHQADLAMFHEKANRPRSR